MRGKPQAQPDFLTVINLNASVTDHPCVRLSGASMRFCGSFCPYLTHSMPACRPIPPEQLLKARVLTALYSVRSERLFCEQLGYNLVFACRGIVNSARAASTTAFSGELTRCNLSAEVA